jgi:poly(A) polymerase
VPQTLGQHSRLTIAGAEWFHLPATQTIFSALNRDGQEVRAVGGAVRNALLGVAVADIDFATTATPGEVETMARAAGLRVVPTGIGHGTMTVIAGGEPFEITTLREDVTAYGRHADVRFGRDWTADARRRDFTMNALYASADGTVHDPLGGYADLCARRVRFIGDARQRIREDYLRIMRFFRFHAEYGHGPHDAEGLHAAITERGGLALLSAERVRAELLRLLGARGAGCAIETMSGSGLLLPVLKGVPRLAVFHRLCGLEAAIGLGADPLLRLAALSLFVAEDAERLAERLRLSKAERRRLCESLPPFDQPVSGEAARTEIYSSGNAAVRDRALLGWAQSRARADDPAWRALYDEAAGWTAPRFPVTGADLLALGMPKGPALGALLKRLESAWAASGFALTHPQLMDVAQQFRKPGPDHR